MSHQEEEEEETKVATAAVKEQKPLTKELVKRKIEKYINKGKQGSTLQALYNKVFHVKKSGGKGANRMEEFCTVLKELVADGVITWKEKKPLERTFYQLTSVALVQIASEEEEEEAYNGEEEEGSKKSGKKRSASSSEEAAAPAAVDVHDLSDEEEEKKPEKKKKKQKVSKQEEEEEEEEGILAD
jgi:hypothetical protein